MTDGPAYRVARARSAQDVDEIRRVYAEWAATYDDDVFGVLGFTGTQRIVELLAEQSPVRDSPVIDLGCGTGAAGERLAALGFSCVDGLDLSPEMLAAAVGKGVYRRHLVADLTRPLPVPDSRYRAAVSAGTFTSGHVGPDALPEVLRILEPGGVLACVVGGEMIGSFVAALQRLPVEVIHATLEPVREDDEAKGLMLLARRL